MDLFWEELDLGVLDKGSGLLFSTKRKAERIALPGVWRNGVRGVRGLGKVDEQRAQGMHA